MSASYLHGTKEGSTYNHSHQTTLVNARSSHESFAKCVCFGGMMLIDMIIGTARGETTQKINVLTC